VHWVSPAPRASVSNRFTTTIVQSGREEAWLGSTVHPLWAAGLHGEGQVRRAPSPADGHGDLKGPLVASENALEHHLLGMVS
jgi:hypothetical protein